MKILDFGCGGAEKVFNLWTPDSGIRILQSIVSQAVGDLVEVHCFDPLIIKNASSVKKGNVQFVFHTDKKTVPDDLDVICALHPDPRTVIHLDRSEESFQHSRYPMILGYSIASKLKDNGHFIVQFDDELGSRKERFLEIVTAEADYEGSSLIEKPHTGEGFVSHTYKFHSIDTFKKGLKK